MQAVLPPQHVLKTVVDTATDDVLDGAYAGWDARVYIADIGADPFEGVDDFDLLHAHAGVMAATVMAQANQMRVLDSAIVPDRDLVRPTEGPSGKFNEFEVYTPTTPAERYAVTTEHGHEEVVTPSSPFYPGLTDREDAVQSAINLDLADETMDPYYIAMATATALLQIGIEAGCDVSQVAEILNKAWGLDDAFSAGTVVGLEGAHDYAALYSRDRNTNARRLASWQNCSYVRSGQLTMATTDWAPMVHCDFRRVRVAAEAMFAASISMETAAGNVQPTGSITYHVPSTSLLCADPQYLFFWDAQPELLAKQERCAAAAHVLEQVDSVGVLRAVWPRTEPVIAATWAASFSAPGGLSMAPVEFIPRPMTAGPLFSGATSRLTKVPQSFALGTGRTYMTTLSARFATMAAGVIKVQNVAWLARFAAVVEIMRLSTSAKQRVEMVRAAWPCLAGDVPRDLERATSKAHMDEMRRVLPAALRNSVPGRSAKIPVFSLLLEVGDSRTARTHTVLKGLKHAFSKAQDVARSAAVSDRINWRDDHAAAWLAARLAVLREFWAVQYAALSQVLAVADSLRTDLKWWIGISAAVNTFRAGVMRGYDVASQGGTAIASAGGVDLRCRPYHAAAHLRKALAPYFTVAIPEFTSGADISVWTEEVAIVTAPRIQRQLNTVVRSAMADSAADHTSHFTRGASLLANEMGLRTWMDATTALVAEDCTQLMEHRARIAALGSPAAAGYASVAMTTALVSAAEKISEAMEKITTAVPVTRCYSEVEEAVPDDVWDDFLEAAYDQTSDTHHMAAKQLSAAKACTDSHVAAAIARWVIATYAVVEMDTGAALK